jgi:hypothetical protein
MIYAHVEKPDIMLLQETKCNIEEMEKILPSCWKQGRGIHSGHGSSRGVISPLEPELDHSGQLFHNQMVHHGGLVTHWLQQARLPNQCLWTSQLKGQTGLPSQPGTSSHYNSREQMDPGR